MQVISVYMSKTQCMWNADCYKKKIAPKALKIHQNKLWNWLIRMIKYFMTMVKFYMKTLCIWFIMIGWNFMLFYAEWAPCLSWQTIFYSCPTLNCQRPLFPSISDLHKPTYLFIIEAIFHYNFKQYFLIYGDKKSSFTISHSAALCIDLIISDFLHFLVLKPIIYKLTGTWYQSTQVPVGLLMLPYSSLF